MKAKPRDILVWLASTGLTVKQVTNRLQRLKMATRSAIPASTAIRTSGSESRSMEVRGNMGGARTDDPGWCFSEQSNSWHLPLTGKICTSIATTCGLVCNRIHCCLPCVVEGLTDCTHEDTPGVIDTTVTAGRSTAESGIRFASKNDSCMRQFCLLKIMGCGMLRVGMDQKVADKQMLDVASDRVAVDTCCSAAVNYEAAFLAFSGRCNGKACDEPVRGST